MLSISQAASQIGVAPGTLRRWEKKGIIKPMRTPGNYRRYDLPSIHSILKKADQNTVFQKKNIINQTPLPIKHKEQPKSGVEQYAAGPANS